MNSDPKTTIEEDYASFAPEKFFSSASDRNDVLASYRQWLAINKPVYVKYFSLVAILFLALLIPFDFILFPEGLLYVRLRVISIIMLLLNIYILSKSRIISRELQSKGSPIIILLVPGLLLVLTYEYWLYSTLGPSYTIVLTANYMVAFFATFFYHRFWKEQYILNSVSIAGLIIVSAFRPDILVDCILLIIFHLCSAVLAFFFRRQFVGSMYVVNLKRAHRELQAAKERAEVSDKLKSVFLSTMSHEVRTPLNVILGYTDLLQMSLGDDLTAEQKEFVDIINQGSTRLIRLMDDILDISRIEAGKMNLQHQILNGDEIVAKAVKEITASIKKKNLDLIQEYNSRNTTIRVDEIRMQQVLGNVLNNAVKFTKSGSITIRTEHQGTEYRVLVSDTGIGIPEESLTSIFSSFKQAEEGFSRSYEGVGLGLTISQRLIKAMNGKIEVISSVGKGSTFTICVPAEGEQAVNTENIPTVINPKMSEESEMQLVEQKKEQKKLLVLEDNPANIKYFEFLLKKLGYTCIPVESGPMALEKIGEIQPDGMLIDISLSDEMDGIEFLRHVREREQFIETPAIAVTAHAMKGMREDLLKQGFTDYLSKPFTVNSLAEILTKYL